MLVQANEYQIRKKEYPTILIDDLPAELDNKARKVVLDLLCYLNMQLFITTTMPEKLEFKNTEYKWFHVKHGKVAKMLK